MKGLTCKLRRIMTSPSNKRVIDFFVDEDEHNLDKLESEVGKNLIKKAQAEGIINIKKNEDDVGLKLDTVYLTKDKGVPLLKAKSHLNINWAKWAAIAAAFSFIATIATPLYLRYSDEARKTAIFYYAFDNDVSQVNKKEIESIECWQGPTGRNDEFKCSKSSSLIFPCFRHFTDYELVKCPKSPSDKDESGLYLTDANKNSEPGNMKIFQEITPWYISLNTGEKCEFISGATTSIANRRMDFGCKDSKTTLHLPLSEDNGVYSISCLKNGRLERCEIKEMWK